LSFYTELRRRSVFKVGAAYAIVAWLLLQITDIVLPTFNAPQWVLQTITFLLILGLPVAIILAWAYEMTPAGIKADGDVDPSMPVVAAAGSRWNVIILGLVVAAVGFIAVDQYVLVDEAPATVVDTISTETETSPEAVASTVNSGSRNVVQRHQFDIGGTIPMGATASIEAEPTISPDGLRLVYSANRGNGIELHSRLLNEFESSTVAGISPARVPFFSPDGLWVGYGSSTTSLSKISTRGGSPQLLTDEIGLFFGGSWGDDDTIIFSTNDSVGSYLASIRAAGGSPERLTTPEPGMSHRWPELLPGGREVLFSISVTEGSVMEGSVAVLSLETGEVRTLIPGAFNARYAPTGHIVFVRDDGLWAVPFELESLDTQGAPSRVLGDIQMNTISGHAPYNISDDGTLVYARGTDRSGAGGRNLFWVDREGRETPIDAGVENYWYPNLSPDGARLAVSHGSDAANLDVWVYDLERGTQYPLTFGADATEIEPLWTPDGESVVYYSARGDGDSGIFIRAADGTAQEERLTTSSSDQIPQSFTPDGAWLVYQQGSPGTSQDLHLMSLDGERESRPLLNEPYIEGAASISPNGRWIAYTSNESGQVRVYVRPFPNIDDGKWQVSNVASWAPHWRADGRELLYRTGGNSFGAVDIDGEEPFQAGPPKSFDVAIPFIFVLGAAPNFGVAPDGQRFLVMTDAAVDETGERRTSIAIVNNWFEELNRLVPTGN
jgi:serine/threonine-protein kinase